MLMKLCFFFFFLLRVRREEIVKKVWSFCLAAFQGNSRSNIRKFSAFFVVPSSRAQVNSKHTRPEEHTQISFRGSASRSGRGSESGLARRFPIPRQ